MHSIKDEFILVYNISVLFFFILFHFLKFTLSSEKKKKFILPRSTAITMPPPTEQQSLPCHHPRTVATHCWTTQIVHVKDQSSHHAVEQPHNNQGTPTENSEQQTHTTTTTTKTSNPSSSLPLSLSLTPANATSVTLWEFFFGESKDIILTQEHHIQLGASACPFQILNSPIQLNASISYKWSNLFRLEMEECWLELVFLIL